MPDTTLTSAELDEIERAFDDASPNEEIGAFLGNGAWASAGDVASFRRTLSLARAGLEAGKAEEWLPIETAPFNKQPVLIAVPNKDRTEYIVGEAHFDPDNEGGDWWWAGSGWGDYYVGAVSEINHWPPEFWRPLPAPPAIRALPLTGDKP